MTATAAALLLLCLAAVPCRPAAGSTAGRVITGSDIELVHGGREELRCIVTLRDGLRAGYRAQDDMHAWFATAGRDHGPCRAVAGAFRITLGNGLLCGGGGRFFPFTWRRSHPRRIVRIAPSLSLWHHRYGAALSLYASGGSLHLALFERSGGSAGAGEAPAAMAALSMRRRRITGAAAMIVPLAPKDMSGSRSVSRAPLLHLSSAVESEGAFATQELDVVDGRAYGSVETGISAPIRGSIKLFRAPDLDDIGTWDQVLLHPSGRFEGMAIHLVPAAPASFARFYMRSTVRYQVAGRQRRRSCGIVLGGKDGRRASWTLDCSAQEERRSAYAVSQWIGEPARSCRRGFRVRAGMSMRNRWHRQRIRTDLRFDRVTMKPRGAAASVEMECSRRWLMITARIQGWALAQGNPLLIFRPGIGSFEYWSLVYGRGSDLCIRVRIEAARSLMLTGFLGMPWEKSKRSYVAIRWKF